MSLRDSLLADGHGLPALWVEDGRVQRANQAARLLFGRDLAGRRLTELFDEASVGKIERIASSPASGAQRTELQIERPGVMPEAARFVVAHAEPGTLLFIGELSGIVYPRDAGARLISAIDELTTSLREQSRQARNAEAAKASLERVSDLRELFVAALAHDLRSPLNAVLLAETVLENAGITLESEELERHSRQVERNVRLALDLIDSVVLAAKLDAEHPQLAFEETRLGDVAREWLDSLAPIAAAAHVEITLSAGDLPPIRGDRTRLGEILSNLLTNAIRHSPPGGRVSLHLDRQGTRVRCAVADEGPGIPPSLRTRIFEKFFQGSAGRGVSGLGLYVCRRVIELHGGEIWVEDNRPTGARFVFTLPIPEAFESRPQSPSDERGSR